MAGGEQHGPWNGSTTQEGRSRVDADESATGDAVADLSSQIQPILNKLEALGQDAIELFDIHVDRARSGVRQGGERVVIAAWIGFLGLALSVMAAILMARGLAGGLTMLFGGRVWLADLAAALLMIAACAAALFTWRSSRAHRALERQKAKHESKSNGESPDATRLD